MNEYKCYYHKNVQAVGECIKCGKKLCLNCCDMVSTNKGNYICYDCIGNIVENDLKKINIKNLNIRKQLIPLIVGCIIGAAIGFIWGADEGIMVSLVYGILCAAIGGSINTFIKNFIAAIPFFFVSTGNVALSVCVGVSKFIIFFFVYALKALIETGKKIVHCIQYSKKNKRITKLENVALSVINDYIQFTKAYNKSESTDEIGFVKQSHEFTNNYYVKEMKERGKNGADANIHQYIECIFENNKEIDEII